MTTVKNVLSVKFINGSDFNGTIGTQQLATALQTLALYFDATREERGRDGVLRQHNPLAYLQRRTLNGLCYTFARMLQGSQGSLVQAKADAKAAGRRFQNDEISLEEVTRRTEWVERLEGQICMAQQLLDVAMAAHLFYVGSRYEMPAQDNELSATTAKPTPTTPSRKAEALERLKRLGLLEADTQAERSDGMATVERLAAEEVGKLSPGGEVNGPVKGVIRGPVNGPVNGPARKANPTPAS